MNIYTVNPETLKVSHNISQADCRGVGDWEIVTPHKMTLTQIINYCNNNWAAPDDNPDYYGLEWEN